MKKINYFSLLMILIFFFTSPSNLFSNYRGDGKDKGKKTGLQKTNSNPTQSLLNINNASMWVSDAGYHDWVIASSWNGAFPNGTSVGAIFAEGIVWGGQVYDGGTQLIRVAGNDYGSGCAPITRLYRVRPDYLTANLAADAAGFNSIPVGQVTEGDIQALRDQYATDWNEWPAYDGSPDGNQGAPYKDVDTNGVYDPTVDIPGIPGASQTLFIKYNDSQSPSHFGSQPIGLEVSEVYWAYAYSGALGNVIYKNVNIVYKGTPSSAANSRIDSMYIVQWADPDVGVPSDDYAGCDTTLNLGYAYSSKASDGTYAGLGLAPPAVGYDFLSGVSKFTGNPNDSAIIDLKWKRGYKYINRKPMSSYAYFAAGGAWEDPTQGSYEEGALAFYNLMRGVKPRPVYPIASPFPDNVVDKTADGTYLLAGDPVTHTGKIDGIEPAGDRRIMVTNGPISMSLGDTAQIVLATVYGLGTDNLSSITNMKQNDLTAQIVFDQLFQLPSIDPPKVQIANLDNKVILNWGGDAVNVEKIETFSGQNYNFEGYELYQLPSISSSLSDGVLLGTFDLVNDVKAIYDTTIDANGVAIPVLSADGKDAGIKRFFTAEIDKLPGKNVALRNGQDYYYAVVSYAYNPSPLLPFHVLRSPFLVLTAKPQLPAPGIRLTSSPGDTIPTTHSVGSGDGNVVVTVVDPTKLTGHDYKVIFDDSADPVTWSLIDVTADNKLVLSGQVNQTGDNDYLTSDGMQVKVIGPPPGMKGWSITGTRRFSPVNGWPGLGLEGFSSAADPFAYDEATGTIGMAGHFAFGGVGTTLTNSQYHTVVLKLAAVSDANSWDPLTTPTDPNISRAYRWLRSVGTASTPADPSFAPWIINKDAGYPYQDYGYGVPFSAWDMETNPPTRLTVGMFENNVANALLDGRYWPYDASAAFDNTVAREFAFIFSEPYSETPDPAFETNLSGNATLPLMWVMVNARRNANPWAAGDEFEILANHPNISADVFTFTSKAPSSDPALAKTDVEKINVFPNPYYGYQYREIAPNNKYVTFSHLPDNAVIRIFDLSGILVKTINHVSTNGQFDTWNLANDNNYPVASGIYVVYIDMPDLGTTKILKLAVVQEQQMLKVY